MRNGTFRFFSFLISIYSGIGIAVLFGLEADGLSSENMLKTIRGYMILLRDGIFRFPPGRQKWLYAFEQFFTKFDGEWDILDCRLYQQ
jgi:hypothetical protein